MSAERALSSAAQYSALTETTPEYAMASDHPVSVDMSVNNGFGVHPNETSSTTRRRSSVLSFRRTADDENTTSTPANETFHKMHTAAASVVSLNPFDTPDAKEDRLMKIARRDPRNRIRRLVHKGGLPLTRRKNVTGGKARLYYFQDWFHSVCNMNWTTLLATYCIVYIVFWVIFSLLYIPMLYHSDACRHVTGVKEYINTFMLALMVASTIGFGNINIQYECGFYPYVILIIEVLTSLTLDCIFMGIIFVKLSRPQQRKLSIKFSSEAVVNDNVAGCKFPQLQIRVADVRREQLVEAHVRVILYEEVNGPDGYDVTGVTLNCDETADYIFLGLPYLIRHTIDETSPLRKYLPALTDPTNTDEFEIVVIVEGIEGTSSLTVQACESYRKSEVLQGFRFLPMVGNTTTMRRSTSIGRSAHAAYPGYEIDFSRISLTAPNSCARDSTESTG
eukprot:m.192136 g.192136  ORF g.192136 m.192136 type:complete len:449 (-) comp18608_c0_seq6:108-1454(-)